LYSFASVNFLYFAIYLFVGCSILMVIVSLLSSPPSYEQIKGLTYATTIAEDRAVSRKSWNYKDVLLSVIVVIIIALILMYFTG